MLLAEFTFGQALLVVLEVFLFAAWIVILFTILTDLFRDHELSGWAKAGWVIFLIFVPFLAALIYLIARGDGMRERSIRHEQEIRGQVNEYIRETAQGSTAADELTKLAKLHDAGKLTDAQYEDAKAKVIT